MSTAAQFYRAARPEPPRCIGLQLRPYSLGHHITLHAYDSSFLNYASPVFADLVLGVFICSQSWKEWEAWRLSWKLPVFLKVWGWMAGKFDVKADGDRFAQHVAVGSECPEVTVPAGGRSLSAPWESRLKLFMIRELRLTVDEAMDYPLALAWQEYCAHGEREGSLTLLSEADEESLDFIGSDRMKDLAEAASEAGRREVEEQKERAAAQPKEAN